MHFIKHAGLIDIICNKSTIAHFTAEKVQAVLVVFPTGKEQRTIAAFLDREAARIDALIGRLPQAATEDQSVIARFIKLLQEHRAALITAAVTGKIDVRQAA
jgi:type I restriction enzyme S subunit